MERARAVPKTYYLLPEDCGYIECTQIIKILMSRNGKFNKADHVTSKIPVSQILREAKKNQHLKANPLLGCQGFLAKKLIRC